MVCHKATKNDDSNSELAEIALEEVAVDKAQNTEEVWNNKGITFSAAQAANLK